MTAFIASRLVLLFNSMRHVWCEEATAGIMAKHLLEGNFSQPLFEYIQAYDFGIVIMSFLAVPCFFLFGVSTVALRLVPLLFATCLMILIYFLMKRHFSLRAAVLACLFFVFPPPFYTRIFLYCTGKQHEVLVFEFLAISVFYLIFFVKKEEYRLSRGQGRFLFLGLLSASALFFCFSSVITLFSILIFWYMFDKRFFLRK